MKIVGFAGSVRPNSFSRKTLDLLAKVYRDQGVEIQIIDLYELSLPFCDGSARYPEFPDVDKMQKAFSEADGILLVTPEYHGCIPGSMKNALDLMGEQEFKEKVVALVGVMAGLHSTSAISSLRNICRHIHSWVIPQQLIVGNVDRAFDEKGDFSSKDLSVRAHEMIRAHIHATSKLR